MKTELLYLTMITALTAIMWVPYVLDRIAVWGISDAVGYPENPKPQSPWAQRMMKAHANAVENLVMFASLVLAAQMMGISNTVTAGACVVFFWARVVHLAAYAFAVPWVRTLAFSVGFFSQAALAWQLLAA